MWAVSNSQAFFNISALLAERDKQYLTECTKGKTERKYGFPINCNWKSMFFCKYCSWTTVFEFGLLNISWLKLLRNRFAVLQLIKTAFT